MNLWKEVLSQVYAAHHQERGRYNYLFCQGERMPWLKKWIGTGKRVLDLGCRDGALTQCFAEGNQVVCVDIDKNALALIEKRLHVETHWLDLNVEWPFSDASFDVVVCCELLEHLILPAMNVRKVKSVLRAEGSFLGSVPNAFRMRNRWKFLWGKEFDSDPTHLHYFSFDSLTRLLQEQFAEIQIVPVQGKIAPFLPISPLFPNKLNRLFAKDLLWRALK